MGRESQRKDDHMKRVGKRLAIYNLSGVLSRKSLRGDSQFLDLRDSQSLRLQAVVRLGGAELCS